ncbi:hypothetical protein [Pseudomonas sp. P9(2020)]|uniref:hypothetical protein n=1 Tax=Pseudomonas sp. P9(2020) TaxID=2763316 RepID=UPI001B33C5A4|nr:hypothetical protein [Pseudomonas sp. P9(2020)]MBP5947889.1 hypothetical protein [Pseudomonas sp. P9(2020)]
MKDSDGLLGVFLLTAALLTVMIYQGVFGVAYRFNWWLGAIGLDSQSLQFKSGCIVVSFILAVGLIKFCFRLQSTPAVPSSENVWQ